MKFGLQVPNNGIYSDPGFLVELACTAEEVGWDGFFLWDDIASDAGTAVIDPWMVLAAIAVKTKRIRLGPLITPLARRRPWKVARETVALDHLAAGRTVFGVGLGEPANIQFEPFGEAGAPRIRADKLDEGLEIIDALWRGEMQGFQGQHYQLAATKFYPQALQQPRIPIWVAGRWPNKRPFRRAARWDGVFPTGKGLGLHEMMSVEAIGEVIAYVKKHRHQTGPFDIVHLGQTPARSPAEDAQIVTPYAEAGLTWWLEDMHPHRGSSQEIQARIKLGPPKK